MKKIAAALVRRFQRVHGDCAKSNRLLQLALVAALLVGPLLFKADATGGLDDRTREEKAMNKTMKMYRNTYKLFMGLPENSVIFYGGFQGTENDFLFSQIDPYFDPDTQAVEGQLFFVSRPVKRSSRYMLEYWRWTDSTEGYDGFSSAKSYTPKSSPLVIDIPDEPGLYYFGFYSGMATSATGELTEWKIHSSEEMKVPALKQVLRCYKGTEWEDYIREELEKAQQEAKERKARRRGK